MLTIVCLNAGDYLGRGREYVRNLYEAVQSNLSTPLRLECFSDDPVPAVLGGWIGTRPLPHPGLKGWMNKLALFKPGVFAEGERILYLDLDTVITGSLDDIAAYDGDVAMLEDMIFPRQLGSGVMAWRGGFGGHIWQAYVDAGFPEVAGGDQAWIGNKVARVDRLQDLYPNQIASYKMSGGVLSPHTRIVCFHGLPRPHEVTDGWVAKLWGAQ